MWKLYLLLNIKWEIKLKEKLYSTVKNKLKLSLKQVTILIIELLSLFDYTKLRKIIIMLLCIMYRNIYYKVFICTCVYYFTVSFPIKLVI